MLVAVFGVTPALRKFGTSLLESLLSRFYRPSSVMAVSTCDEIRAFRSKAAAGVVYSKVPPEQVTIQFLLQEKIPIIVLIDTFSTATTELVSECGISPLDAIRTTSRWFSTLADVIAASNVFVIRGKTGAKDVGQVAGKIASFLGLSTSLAREAGFAKPWYNNDPPTAASNTPLYDIRTSTVAGLSAKVQGYDQLFDRPPRSYVHWPNSIFHINDKHRTPATDYIELTGPARIVVFGPYMGLPRGRWIASPAITVCDNISGNSITLDISTKSSSEIISKVQSTLPEAGEYFWEIPFEILYSHLPIEVRLILNQGAIEGKLRFEGVTFEAAMTAGGN